MQGRCVDFRVAMKLGVAALALAYAGGAGAQEIGGTAEPRDAQATPADQPGLTDIVVTAQRYSTRLQDTPISIVAVDAEQIQAMGVSNLGDFDKFVPNLSVGGTQGQGNAVAAFSIRGIGGAPGGFVTQEGAVGVYIDDILFARPNGALLDLLDVERIEVLRGPQGTLFGRNTAGGAIRYVSKLPQFGEIAGNLKAALGSYDRRDVSATLNLPLGDGFAARFAAAKKSRDGHIKRLIDNGRVGDEDSSTMRLQLRAQPTTRLDINLSADLIRTHDDGTATIVGSVNGYPRYSVTDAYPNTLYCTAGSPGCVLARQAQARALAPASVSPSGYTDRNADMAFYTAGITDNYTIYGGLTPDLNKLESFGLAGTIAYELTDTISVKSLTGYRETDQIQNQDWDRLPLPIFGLNEEIHISYFTQELQLTGKSFNDRLQWVVGAFYYWDKARDYRRRTGGSGNSNSLYARDGTLLANPASGIGLGELEHKFINTESVAVFGQGSFEITDALSATVGLRWSRDEKVFTAFREGRGRVGGVSLPQTVSGNWSNVSPRFSVQYKWTPDIMTYVSASRGFKGGGFNDTTDTNCTAGDATCGLSDFKPETLWTYEAGLRTDLFDRKVRFNLTGFLTKYKDLQIQYTVVSPTPQQFTVNGDSTVKGFEAEFLAAPIGGLLLRASAGYTNSSYDDDIMDGGVVRISKSAPYFRSPRWSYMLGGSYSARVSDAAELSLDLNWGWKDSMSSTATPANTVILPSYGLLNGRLEYRADAGWSLALVGSNLLDKYYLSGAFDPSGPASKPTPGSTLPHGSVFGFSMLDIGRPRELGVELKFAF